jgi:hypothetical protein
VQYKDNFTAGGYRRVINVAEMTPVELREVCPSMPPGVASSVLRYAKEDVTEIEGVEKRRRLR